MEAFLTSMRDPESGDEDEMPARAPPARRTDQDVALQLHSEINNMRYRPKPAEYSHGPGARVARMRQKQKNESRKAKMEMGIANRRAIVEQQNKLRLAVQKANAKRAADEVKYSLTKNDPSKPPSAAKRQKQAAAKTERKRDRTIAANGAAGKKPTKMKKMDGMPTTNNFRCAPAAHAADCKGQTQVGLDGNTWRSHAVRATKKTAAHHRWVRDSTQRRALDRQKMRGLARR